MNETSLIAQDIYKIYEKGPKDVRAVNGISLDIARGRSIAIIGPSGAGKSTLLHLLGGLDSPSAGAVLLDGIDIYKLPDKERARIRNRKVGFVFQFYHLLPEFTCLENVMLPAFIKCQSVKVSKRQSVKDRAKNILKSVGLEDRIDHKPGELSGGQSQRVAIARALINEPEFLFCDEPTGNLDSKTSELIYELLFSLSSKNNMALVVVTHDEKLSQNTGQTVRIKDGKVV